MSHRSAPFTTSRRVEFRQTDAAGIVHFSTFFAMMEEAEHEFLRHLELPLFLPVEGGTLSWPRISASCDFKCPAKFEDVLQIEVSVERLGSKSVTYGFRFHRDDQLIAEGSMVSVCCFVVVGGEIRAEEIPAEFAEKFSRFTTPG